MKTDLAPKYLYCYSLLVFVLGLVLLVIIHQFTMEYAMNTSDYFPFVFTSVFWVALLLGTMFIINKCRYIIIDPADETRFVMGNLLSNTHGDSKDLQVVKKVWMNLFKVTIEGKPYYAFSFDQVVTEFKQKRSV